MPQANRPSRKHDIRQENERQILDAAETVFAGAGLGGATTQHHADFGHQIETQNGGLPLSGAQWQTAKVSLRSIILKGIGTTGRKA